MRRNRTEKIYAKVFRVINKHGTFTEEDFNLFKEKFEVVRKLYTEDRDIFPLDDNGIPPIIKYIKHDCYGSFRAITREIKRSAHNAELSAELLKVKYQSNSLIISVNKTKEEENGYFNLLVTFKSAANYSEPDKFVITSFTGLENGTTLIDDIGEGIYIKKYMKDDTNVSYHWEGSEE